MTVSYKKLWHILTDKGMLKKDLSEASGVSKGTITKLVKDETVNVEILMKICGALNCDIGDIMEVIPDRERYMRGGKKPTFTKQAICDSFIGFLEQKPLEQITVKDIVDDCDINRKTFYYYYKNIYALADDVFSVHLEQVIGELTPEVHSWRAALETIANYIYKNRVAASHVYKSLKFEKFHNLLYDACMRYIPAFLRKSAEALTVTEDDLMMIARYISVSIAGMLTRWVSRGTETIPTQTIGRFCSVMEGEIELALHNAHRLNNQNQEIL